MSGRVGKLEVESAHAVPETAPVSMDGPVVVVGRTDGGEGRRGGHARGTELEVGQTWGRPGLHIHTVAPGDRGSSIRHLLRSRLIRLQTPSPKASSAHKTLLPNLSAGGAAPPQADVFCLGQLPAPHAPPAGIPALPVGIPGPAASFLGRSRPLGRRTGASPRPKTG